MPVDDATLGGAALGAAGIFGGLLLRFRGAGYRELERVTQRLQRQVDRLEAAEQRCREEQRAAEERCLDRHMRQREDIHALKNALQRAGVTLPQLPSEMRAEAGGAD